MQVEFIRMYLSSLWNEAQISIRLNLCSRSKRSDEKQKNVGGTPDWIRLRKIQPFYPCQDRRPIFLKRKKRTWTMSAWVNKGPTLSWVEDWKKSDDARMWRRVSVFVMLLVYLSQRTPWSLKACEFKSCLSSLQSLLWPWAKSLKRVLIHVSTLEGLRLVNVTVNQHGPMKATWLSCVEWIRLLLDTCPPSGTIFFFANTYGSTPNGTCELEQQSGRPVLWLLGLLAKPPKRSSQSWGPPLPHGVAQGLWKSEVAVCIIFVVSVPVPIYVPDCRDITEGGHIEIVRVVQGMLWSSYG